MSAQFNRIPTHTQDLPDGVLPFSPTEAKILHFLERQDSGIWWPAKAIARRIGEVNTHRFRVICTNLSDRNAIDSCAGHGYRMLVADAKTEKG